MAVIARLLARMAGPLIRYAQRAPYRHLKGYMNRWWVFNPYDEETYATRWPWLPSIRVHHILRADLDRHLHDHPWDARTIILRGWYTEERQAPGPGWQARLQVPGEPPRYLFRRQAGDTARLEYGEFHRIREVSPGGVWTLFITWKYRGTWGFLVKGRKVPYRDYLSHQEGV